MEQIICKGLKFAYPNGSDVLCGIDLKIEKGDFAVICGRSGCGKTTLLRQMKKSVAPAGKLKGEILFNGVPVSQMNDRDSASKIGFVFQNPESQIVTDKVWHELAFGLENLGVESAEIRLRTAEMAAYFGMKDWFDKKISQLSGGQKQLLNLASVMVMRPELIILDEPTSRLDPVAAGNFLATVSKINRELGVTVVMTEHRLEDAFGYANRVIVMDNGVITADCAPSELGGKAERLDSFVRLAMPASVRIFAALGGEGDCPVTVNEGARWLSALLGMPRFSEIDRKKFSFCGNAVEIKNLFYRYEKNGADVISNLNLDVPKGSVFAITGGNGAGKTTLLKILSGVMKPVSGKIKIHGESAKKSNTSVLMLPQDVQLLFTKSTVGEELEKMRTDKNNIADIAALTGISHLLERHPYDLSGGEQQRAALAMLLLKDPDILLLDEPTKGMDSEFKAEFADILKKMTQAGKTVVMVSHDVEFCAAYADFCSMIFDSTVVCVKETAEFFTGNFFYTTSANRMSCGIFKNCVTDKDVISLCKKNICP